MEWIRAKSSSKLVTQMKDELLMSVPETADDFGTLLAPCVLSVRVGV
jgi:hypothetical protein